MKKITAFILCCVFLCSLISVSAFATEAEDILIKCNIEFLENGDYVVSEVYECAVQPRSGKTGYASATYWNSNGDAVWKVTVTGSFTYNGATSSATSATATGTVKYDLVQTTRSASVSCNKNGNLY